MAHGHPIWAPWPLALQQGVHSALRDAALRLLLLSKIHIMCLWLISLSSPDDASTGNAMPWAQAGHPLYRSPLPLGHPFGNPHGEVDRARPSPKCTSPAETRSASRSGWADERGAPRPPPEGLGRFRRSGERHSRVEGTTRARTVHDVEGVWPRPARASTDASARLAHGW